MSLINANHKKEGQSVMADPSNTLIELLPREVEWLLQLIKESTFQGKDVEVVYNTTLKLQQLYLLNNR